MKKVSIAVCLTIVLLCTGCVGSGLHQTPRPQDMVSDGLRYYHGNGVSQDHAKAAELFRKAAEQGNMIAQCNLGAMYMKGQGVVQDETQAAHWYLQAAHQGSATAQLNLGIIYASGMGVQQDYKQSARWYQLAAEQNNPDAQNNLGVLYHEGKGVDKDFSKAAIWFRMAAKQNFAHAQYNLGALYADGEGVPQNLELAIEWYEKSAKQGYAPAIDALAEAKKAYASRPASPPPPARPQTPPPPPSAPQTRIAFGTAFFVNNTGLLVTNHHVIGGATECIIYDPQGRRSATAKVLRIDSANDLAILQANVQSAAIPIAATNGLKRGEEVLTLGYPRPDVQGVQQKATFGRVNAITGYGDDNRLVQVDLPIQPGNSGGPLLNTKGEAVGIVTATLKDAQNVNYAVKVEYLHPLLTGMPMNSQPISVGQLRMEQIVERFQHSVVLVYVKK